MFACTTVIQCGQIARINSALQTKTVGRQFGYVPRKRLSSEKSRLAPCETDICLRVKAARMRLGLDQAEVAARLGVKVHVLANIEKCRAPLRCDLALRVCRELFVNEEWLACGSPALLFQVLRSKKVSEAGLLEWGDIFFRTPLDLLSHAVAQSVPPRALYSTAYEQFLAPVAAELSAKSWLLPSLSFTAYDRRGLRSDFLALLVDRWSKLLIFRARELGLPEEVWPTVEANFIDDLRLVGMLVFYRSFGTPTPFQVNPRFDFLRTLAGSDSAPIGTLASVQSVSFEGDKVVFGEPLLPQN